VEVEMILMRQLASYLTLPIFLVDADGNLVFFNEAAEPHLGRRFEEAGEMPLSELGTIFEIAREDGSPFPADEFPLAVALQQKRPTHEMVRFRALDGLLHTVEVTAFPLEGQGGRHLGAVAIFWENNV
jgi:PAS domain S-box-containing protein